MKGLIITKVCKSTKAVTGCGKTKLITDFPKTKNGHQSCCKLCVTEKRRVKDKAEKETSPETKLFNQANIAWR